MLEGVRLDEGRLGRLQPPGGGILQQRLSRLARKVLGQVEEVVLNSAAYRRQPLLRHADAQQGLVVQPVEQEARRRLRGHGRSRLPLGRPPTRQVWLGFFHPLAHLDDLHRPGAWMGLDPPPLGPGVGGVMMIDIGDQQARARLVEDQPDVAIDPRRPEVEILRRRDPVHLQTRRRRVQLQIHDADLHRLLLLRGKPREGVSEGVGEAEVHPCYPAFSSRARHTALSISSGSGPRAE